eukprot:13740018-Alexandrium_andersonii.AAC.1
MPSLTIISGTGGRLSPTPPPPAGKPWPGPSWLAAPARRASTACPMRSTTMGSTSAPACWRSSSMRR